MTHLKQVNGNGIKCNTASLIDYCFKTELMNGLSNLLQSVLGDDVFSQEDVRQDLLKLMELVESHTPDLTELKEEMNV